VFENTHNRDNPMIMIILQLYAGPLILRPAIVALLVMLCACSGNDSGERNTAEATAVYRCTDGYSFTARSSAEYAWLFLPGETVKFERTPSASGSKYIKDRSLFWSKGEEAMLEHNGRTHNDCSNDRRAAVWEHAKLNGVDFRAVGNEPGWHLEISNKNNIRLVTDYGQSSYEFNDATIDAMPAEHRTLYRASGGGHEIETTLLAETCRDTMVDETYPTRVLISLDGRTLRGCGRALH
jgi:uncharacterized membrane protein